MCAISLLSRLSAVVGAVLLLAGCQLVPAGRPAAAPAPPGQPAAAPAQSFDEQTVARFYRGKTVRLIVGFAAGGGYDTYTRLIGRHLGKYLPGNPTVVVENMPGGGSLVALNYLYNAAPKDGTVIATYNGPLVLDQLFGTPGVEFDMARLRHLAVPVRETFVLVAAKRVGITKFEDLLGPQGKQLVVGVIPGALENAAILSRDVLGANLKIVSGYDGTSKIRLALGGGEVDGLFNTWQSVKITNRAEVESGEWVVLATLADEPLKDLPSIPAIPALAKTAEQRHLLRFGAYVPNAFAKIYSLPPAVPADRADALEAAFAKTLADPEFLAEAEKGQLEIDPLFGDEIQRLVGDFLGMPSDLKARLKALLQPAG